MHSILLIGQSNMAGRGELSNLPKMDTSRLYVMRNGRYQPLFRPVNPDRSFAGFNLAESFAEKYAKKYGVDVGLIPCADGGTSLSQWEVGSLLYENALNHARLASRTSTIVAVLWHQGEADCANELYPVYQEKFEKILNGFRKELGLENVPFLLGGLGDFLADCVLDEKLKNYAKVNEQLEKIAKENEKVGFVSATGLTAKADNLHFDTNGLYEFGLRYFEKYEELRDGRSIKESASADVIRTEMEKL